MRPFLGITLKLFSALAFSLMYAGGKFLSDRYPTGEIVFFRSFFALVPLLLWLGWQGGLISAVRTTNIFGHVKRGLFGSFGMFCGFASLMFLPLPEAIAIGYAAPFIATILAALILKERVHIYRWSAVSLGFVGVGVMLWPHAQSAHLAMLGERGPLLGAMLALMGAVGAGGAAIQVRQLVATEATGAVVFYFSLFTTLLGLSTALFGWTLPQGQDIAILIGIGIMGGIGQILLTQSYRFAEASLIAPFDYTTMIWALLTGWFLFAEWPTPIVMVGAAIVMASGLFVIWRETRLGLQTAKAHEAGPKGVG